MVAYRKLPSGKWQASVNLPQKTPNGTPRRVTKTHALKSVVKRWADHLEAQIAAGQWTDPRSGDVTLSAWREQRDATRLAAGSTIRKDDSHWRVHVEPRWGGHPLNTITKQGIRAWVKEMFERQCRWCRTTPKVTAAHVMARHNTDGELCPGSTHKPGLPAATVRGAATTLSALLHAAVDADLLAVNPAAGMKLPRQDAKPVFWWTHTEARKMVAALPPQYRLMVDLDFHCGLRLGELLGLRRKYIQETEDGRLIVHVVGVKTRDGWREYPKSKLSRRPVPVPKQLMISLAHQLKDLQPDDIVFAAPGGEAWDDRNWSRRVFEPALRAAGVKHGTPHDMRHTAASWLVQEGVDLYVVQALLGHESFRTTQRYSHLAPESFDKVIKAWEDMEADEDDD